MEVHKHSYIILSGLTALIFIEVADKALEVMRLFGLSGAEIYLIAQVLLLIFGIWFLVIMIAYLQKCKI